MSKTSYVTFEVMGKLYGLDIYDVQEICRLNDNEMGDTFYIRHEHIPFIIADGQEFHASSRAIVANVDGSKYAILADKVCEVTSIGCEQYQIPHDQSDDTGVSK